MQFLYEIKIENRKKTLISNRLTYLIYNIYQHILQTLGYNTSAINYLP